MYTGGGLAGTGTDAWLAQDHGSISLRGVPSQALHRSEQLLQTRCKSSGGAAAFKSLDQWGVSSMKITVKKFALAALLPLVSAAILVGCAAKPVEKNEYSGFLKDYSKLQLATTPSGTPVMRWINPELGKGKYDKILLEQPVLFLGKDQKPTSQVSKQTMDEIVQYLGNAQRELLQRKLALASGPGPRTLQVRAAITAVRSDKEGLKPYEVVPVALVFAAVSSASGTRDQTSEIYIEGEAVDSQTGETMISFVRKDSGPELENDSVKLTLKDMQPLLDKWTNEFYAQLKNYTDMH
jgi:hypothetical protein